MRLHSWLKLSGITAALCFAQSALAHPGHATGGGFITGILHPLSGCDHILAMIAVGLCAAQAGGRAAWLLPCTFLDAMAGGGMLATVHSHVPFVEQAIALSILIFGLLIATGSRMALPAMAVLVGFSAMFHGYAHGAEMQAGLNPAAYGIGFILATTLLLGIGVGAGFLLRQHALLKLARIAGGFVAACGVAYFAILI